MEEDDAVMAEMQKLKGLIQIDQQFLVSMVMTNLKSWKDIWRNVRQVYDQDKNGFVSTEELEDMFKQYFPHQLEGKSMCLYFKGYLSFYDKSLVNYRQLRDEINAIIHQKLEEMKDNPNLNSVERNEEIP
jgi:Ca2+-binding EF-hand superfamily protein